MGNSVGCSASGERLVSAARDGDAVEVRMLLSLNPALSRYSTFGGLNSPLHFASAKGHAEIATLLLESGAYVNSRNYCGQTALMHACRHGHWEVAQILLIFRCNVTKADLLSGRTALHFAAFAGHVRCVRLLLADFVPSAALDESVDPPPSDDTGSKFDLSARLRFINKPADGGITALHMAALKGYSECAQLLLDLGANVSAVTFHYGTPANSIGSGSTPLHFAAYSGNVKCCQILVARGASRLTLNCSGWLPVDVAKMHGRHWLEPILSPDGRTSIPAFPPSAFLCLPLMSILNIAREFGLQAPVMDADHGELCAVCLERACTVASERCKHELCVKCALYLCSTSSIPTEFTGPRGSVPCPLCRNGIVSFFKLPYSPPSESPGSSGLGLCNPCISHPLASESPAMVCKPEIRRNRVAAVPSELGCALTCSPFLSTTAISSHECDDALSFNTGTQDGADGWSSGLSASITIEGNESEEQEEHRTSCSGALFSKRSNHREQLCNAEISS